jgi:hypothetical protein
MIKALAFTLLFLGSIVNANAQLVTTGGGRGDLVTPVIIMTDVATSSTSTPIAVFTVTVPPNSRYIIQATAVFIAPGTVVPRFRGTLAPLQTKAICNQMSALALFTPNSNLLEPNHVNFTCIVDTVATSASLVVGFTSSVAGMVVTVVKGSFYSIKNIAIP